MSPLNSPQPFTLSVRFTRTDGVSIAPWQSIVGLDARGSLESGSGPCRAELSQIKRVVSDRIRGTGLKAEFRVENQCDEIEFSDVTTAPPAEVRTFEDWQQRGFIINKGARAAWYDGKPYFSESQVSERNEFTSLTFNVPDESLDEFDWCDDGTFPFSQKDLY